MVSLRVSRPATANKIVTWTIMCIVHHNQRKKRTEKKERKITHYKPNFNPQQPQRLRKVFGKQPQWLRKKYICSNVMRLLFFLSPWGYSLLRRWGCCAFYSVWFFFISSLFSFIFVCGVLCTRWFMTLYMEAHEDERCATVCCVSLNPCSLTTVSQ